MTSAWVGLWLAAAASPAPVDPSAEVDVVERLGERVPVAIELVGEDGAAVRVGDLLAEGRPVLLSLVYFACPALCHRTSWSLAAALRGSGLALGRDLVAVSISIDPAEGPPLAAERKARYLEAFGAAPAAGWRFLTGEGSAVRALADSVGVRYARDPATGEYAHPAVAVVLTPEGRVARYLYGIDPKARDLRLSVVEAAGGRVGTTLDRVLLTCFRYDPARRRYAPFLAGFLRLGGLAVFAAVASMLGILWHRERRRPATVGGRTGERP